MSTIAEINTKAKEALQKSQAVSGLLEEIIILSEVEEGIYYVSVNGNDANPGTLNLPWRTIQHAADIVQPGDTVSILEGTYKERVILKTSGTADAPITFQGDGAVIDGEGIVFTDGRRSLFDTNAKSYIKIENLRVINSYYFGIGCMAGETNNGHDIIIDYCSTYNTGSSGIAFFWGANITTCHNIVELSNTKHEQEAISLHGIQGFQISSNEVFDGLMEGIDAKGGSKNGTIYNNYVHDLLGGEWDMNGIYLDAWDRVESNNEIYNNIIERCGNGIIVGAENNGHLDGAYIHDNTIKYCRAGFNVSGWGIGTTHTVENVVFDHNTIIGAADNAITYSNASARNIKLTNNTLGGRYSYTDAIEMTKGVTSVDPSVIIDGNILCKFGTKASNLNGTNYTLLEKAPMPTNVTVSSGLVVSITWEGTAKEFEIWRCNSTLSTGYYKQIAVVQTNNFADIGLPVGTYWYKIIADNGMAASDPTIPVKIKKT